MAGAETSAEAVLTPREALGAGEEIVRRLRKERERQGLSREKLARLGGPSVCCIQGLERGRNRPLLTTLIRYAAVLKWRVELVSREDD